MQNVPREHSAMLSTFIKLPFVVETFVLFIFEWSFKTAFTVFRIFNFFNFLIYNFDQIYIKKHALTWPFNLCTLFKKIAVPFKQVLREIRY